jgi:iron-sulfur cluster assembly protein
MITLTEQAAEKVRQNLAKRGHGLGIRLGVKTTGCSGLAYVLEYVDQPNALRPMTFDSNGITIYVDTKDMVYLDGMTLDWKREGLQEGFDFINPNESARCGCGSSFKI